MAITIPNSYAGNNLGNIVAGQPVLASDFERILLDQHRLFAVKGFRVPGFLAEHWETTTAGQGALWAPTVAAPSWTQNNSLTKAPNASTWSPTLRAFRDLEGDVLAVRVAAFLMRARVRVSVYAPDTDTTLATITLANTTTTWGWQRGYLTLTAAQARAGGLVGGAPRPLSLFAEGATDGGSDGRIAQIAAREYVLTSTDTALIPRG